MSGRSFLVLLLAFLTSTATVAAWQVWAVWNDVWPFEALFSYGLAVMTGPAFSSSLLAPLYNSAEVIRALFQQGWNPPDRPYYEELARYLEARGEHGRLPSDVRWGVAGWGVYIGMTGIAIGFTLAFLPYIGPWTPYVFASVDALVTATFSVWHMVFVGSLLSTAETEGFRLLQLHPHRIRKHG